ncbi:ABC transporter ATP-binding protein [Arthrobacter sp. Helios]|uniref:sulfate/molybdate ABC transporter ATP-binding protein n=1 Tax=Arthrobacter sp. Helios TaxID=2828862 RepID=UPI0020521EF0|nr:ABC transporter ATP-binding protein [Arthrobacter sp. Helios]UPO78143.1 ABC transporter ATP-binding protein [Arthrobacter sp. Helios]
MRLDLRAVVAERGIDVTLEIAAGETVALLGPNGAGKSTVVSLIAGLLQPEAGRAELGGKLLFDVGAGVRVPPHRRGTALLAQEALLFPHLTAEENVAFGPRSAGVPRRQARSTARFWLEQADAAGFASRKPAELSGGQAQRVALARALAAEPSLLLLDEPMAALDVEAVPLMRRLLKRVLAKRSALIVTHNVLDALTLADKVLVMEGGRIVESGSPASVLSQPRTRFTASLAGLNTVRGTWERGRLVTREGLALTLRDPESLPQSAAVPGGSVIAAFPPSAVSVFAAGAVPSTMSGADILLATVTDLEPHGGHIRVRAAGLAADISPVQAAELSLMVGQEVCLVLQSAAVSCYPA